MSGAIWRTIEFLDSVISGADDDDAPDALNYGEPAVRVWLDDPDHAPGGYATFRCPGGLHYYDLPLSDGIETAEAPDDFVYLEAVDRGDAAGQHPYGLMAMKAASSSSVEWVPYQGPQGGEGWKNLETGDITYDEEPPGGAINPDDVQEPSVPVKRFSEFEAGQSIAIETHEGVATGLVLEVNEEEGAMPGQSDKELTIMLEDGSRDTVDMEDLRNAASVKVSPDSPDGPGGGDSEGAPDRIADLDVDWDDTTEDTREGYPMLTGATQAQLERELEKKHGEDVVRDFQELANSWKSSSYSNRAKKREMAFKEALGLDGEPRNHGLEAEPPSEEMVEVAKDIAAASQHFIEENYADEDGNFEVHRGVSSRVGNRIQTDVLAKLAQGETDTGSVEMNLNAMDNYSVSRDVAETWGEMSATISQERNVEDVAVATDMVTNVGGEGEVSVEGGVQSVGLDEISVQNDWSPARLMEGDLDDLNAGEYRDILKSSRHLMNAMSRSIDALEEGRDPDAMPNEAAVDGIEMVADAAIENVPSQDEAIEEGTEALADALEGEEFFTDAIEPVVRDTAGIDAWMDLQEFTPFGSDDPQEWAESVVPNMTSAMTEEEAEEVLEELTGEAGIELGESYAAKFAEAAKEDINELREKMERASEGESTEEYIEYAINNEGKASVVGDAVSREVGSGTYRDIMADIREDTPDASAEERAQVLIDRLPDLFGDVMAENAMERAAERLEDEAGMRGPYDGDLSLDQKADPEDTSVDIETTDDPDNIDWIARSRDEREGEDEPGPDAGDRLTEALDEKSWIPYTGPQGGDGWQNVEDGEVVYDDEPPGQTLSPEDLLAAAEEAGMDPDETEEAVERLQDALGEADGSTVEDETTGIESVNEVSYGDEITFEYRGETFTGEVDGTSTRAGNIYVRPEDPGDFGGQTRVTIDPEDVRSGGKYESIDNENVERALRSHEDADTGSLTDEMAEDVEDRIKHDAGNVVNEDVASTLFGHVKKFERKGLNNDDSDRAFHRGRASWATDPEKGSVMGLGASGSSDDTITHEFGHALADAYGFDTPGEKKTSHNWSEGERGPTENGFRDGWDFGGKHDDKKDYLFTSYGDWEDRGEKDWGDYADRGEPISGTDDVSIGDRVAVDNPGADITSIGLGQRVTVEQLNGDQVSGEVVDEAGYEGDRISVELDSGKTVPIDEGDIAEVDGRGFGSGTVEGTVMHNSEPYGEEDVTDLMDDGTLSEGTEVVIETEDGDTFKGEATTQHDDWDNTIFVKNPPEHNYDGWYSMDQIAGIEGQEEPEYAIKNPNTGAEVPVDDSDLDPERAVKMRSADERDWVPLDDFGEGELRGEAVRFKFGAQDKAREGVITEESNGQVLVEFIDGNGNQNERWVNKSQSFQQSVWVAEDRREFGEPEPSDSPPGWDEARYRSLEVSEEDVNWDTHIQYEDLDEVKGKLRAGDMMLVDLGGHRVPGKISEVRGGGMTSGDLEIDIRYPKDVEEELRENFRDIPYGALIEDGGNFGQLRLPDDDIKLWGHAEKEQFIDNPYEDMDLDDFDGDASALAPGDVVEFTTDSETGIGADRTIRAKVTGSGTYQGGEDYIEFDDGDETFSRYVDVVDVDKARPAEGGARVTGDWDDSSWSAWDLREHDGKTVRVEDFDTGDTVEGELHVGVSREGDNPEVVMKIYGENGDNYSKEVEIEDEDAGLGYTLNSSSSFEVDAVMEGETLEGGQPVTEGMTTDDLEVGHLVQYETADGESRVSEVDEIVDEGQFTFRTEDGEIMELGGGAPPHPRRVGEPGDPVPADESSDDMTDKEAVEKLMEEVNKSWWDMAAKRDEGRKRHAVGPIGTTYSESNAHETLAMTHQVMQTNSTPSDVTTLHDKHPGLLDAYLNVFEPSDEVKEALNEAYEENPRRSVFDDEPFPEVVPEEVDYESILPDGREVPVPSGYPGEGGSAEVRGIIEGDLLYETEDGEEHWGSPDEFVEAMAPDVGSTGRVPDEHGGGQAVVTDVTPGSVVLSPTGSDEDVTVPIEDYMEAQA